LIAVRRASGLIVVKRGSPPEVPIVAAAVPAQRASDAQPAAPAGRRA
jgi:hypothetical protein